MNDLSELVAIRDIRVFYAGVIDLDFSLKCFLNEQWPIVPEVERRLSLGEGVEAVVAANLKRAERLRQSILKQAFEGAGWCRKTWRMNRPRCCWSGFGRRRMGGRVGSCGCRESYS